VTRIPLTGEPAPARRIVAATRAGAGTNGTVSRAIATITRTAARLLPPRPAVPDREPHATSARTV
jgi:hypothetical protein